MKLFDSLNIRKLIAPVTALAHGNASAIEALSLKMAEQFSQVQKAQKALSMQTEELYDCVSGLAPTGESDTQALVEAATSLRDSINNLREYAVSRGDEELTRQVELLILVCDRKLLGAGIISVKREGEMYDKRMDVVADVERASGNNLGAIAKELSGCYKYHGEIVKRASVVVYKGEADG